MNKFVVALTFAATSTGAVAQSWSVGTEREVDEGYYLKLLKVANGWRLWRLETKNGVSCQAIKSARGRPHPTPVGVGGGFYGGTPFLTVFKGYQGHISYGWQGRHLNGERTKYREPSARFWEDWKYDADLAPFDGKQLEVNITTFEYPEIRVGRVEETAIIDLTGLSEISTEVLNCG